MRATTASPTLYASLTDDVVASGSETIPVPTPSTGAVLHELPRCSAGDVRDAIGRARLAQLAWARAGFAERRRVLLRAHDLLLERSDVLLDLVQLESGKTRGQAFEELYQAASVTRYNALSAKRVLRGRARRSGVPLAATTRVRYRAKGVVGVITPWNYALSLTAMDVVPALAAGCGVVQKADEQGALSILALRRAFIEAGVPESLWAVVAGPADEVGEALTDEVDYVCFTGSTATGRRIAEKAGRRLVGASLELGGKNAMIVLDDVDPEQAAADAANACFSAMGQLCVSIERIYVHRKVATPFTAALIERLTGARLGSALDFDRLRLAHDRRPARARRGSPRRRGREGRDGARRRSPPPRPRPLLLRADGAHGRHARDAACTPRRPSAPSRRSTSSTTRRRRSLAANASEYGLNASVLTRSRRRGQRVADALEAGSVNVNEGYRGTFGIRRRADGRHQGSPASVGATVQRGCSASRSPHDLGVDRPAAAAAHGPRVRGARGADAPARSRAPRHPSPLTCIRFDRARWPRSRTARAPPLPAPRACACAAVGGVLVHPAPLAPRRAGRLGERVVVEERLADDAARVVLARVELRPVDLVELRAHLVAHPVLRTVGHVAQRPHQAAELRGVAGQAVGADEEDRDQRDDQQLVEGQPEGHPLRILRRCAGARGPRLEPRDWERTCPRKI